MTGAITVGVSRTRETREALAGVHELMSVANFLEAALVVEGRAGLAGGHELDLFIERASIELVPVSVEHAQAARLAWQRFGKGNHPEGLNFEDCFAYALAEVTGEPLLYKGDDFALTDVESA